MIRRSIDWKKIAQKRLVELRVLRRRCDLLHDRMADEIEKEMIKNLFARCIPRDFYEGKVKTIAGAVADRLKPEVP